jgi:hypothetical protein
MSLPTLYSKLLTGLKRNKLASWLSLSSACIGSCFAAASVTSLSGMNQSMNHVFQLGAATMTNVGAVSGFGLFFVGIFTLYNSHVKGSNGGKPMSHGLMMIGAGACLIGLPYMYQSVGTTVFGTAAKIGDTTVVAGSKIFGAKS